MKEPTAAGRELERPASALGSAHMRIAVLDTDSGFLQVLGKRLERLGWEQRVLASPVPTDTVVAMRLNAIVIDLAVLGPQAWEYLEKLCAALPGLGVVVCTAQSTVAQRVRGLRLGADDWLTKPCHPEELLARVEAVVRRRRRAEAREERAPIHAGEVEIRADRFQAYVDGASVDLTRREFELIELLAGAEGRVLEREEIYQRVWGYAMARGDRSVDVFVRKLRQKLEKASPEWRYIHTHFGVGYRFSPEPAEGTAAAEAAAASAAPVDAAASAAAGSAPAPAVGARARVTGGGRRASADPVDGDPPDADALVAHARSAVS
jgi:DNA-binding response OmpR family regulator